MKTKSYAKIAILLILAVGAFLIFKKAPEPETNIGSALGEEMQATSTADMNRSATGLQDGGSFTVQEHRTIATTTPIEKVPYWTEAVPSSSQRWTSIMLGSVIVASSSIGSLIIHDATSTEDMASSTIAIFDNDNNATAGTYVFDTILTRGLILDFEAGFNGSYIITWR